MIGLKERICKNCACEFETVGAAKYCSHGCRTPRDKGGKTVIDKQIEKTESINIRWLNRGPQKRKEEKTYFKEY